MGIFDKGVKKTNMGFFQRLSHAIVGKAKVDDDLLDAIEEALVATDMGVARGGVYMSKPVSRFVLPSPSSTMSTSSSSTSASLSLACKYVHPYHFPTSHIYVLIY